MNTQTLLSIVADQREELLANDYSELCPRPEESQLDLKSNRAQVVIGVRRCGKSTLCEMFLKQKGIDFAYVNFDDDRMEDMKASDLDHLLEALYMTYGEFKYLFLDEIQNIEGWPLFVNRLLRQKIHLFITGSNSKLLSKELSTHLTGRNNKVELYPFSYSEYCAMKNIDTTSLPEKWEPLPNYSHQQKRRVFAKVPCMNIFYKVDSQNCSMKVIVEVTLTDYWMPSSRMI